MSYGQILWTVRSSRMAGRAERQTPRSANAKARAGHTTAASPIMSSHPWPNGEPLD